MERTIRPKTVKPFDFDRFVESKASPLIKIQVLTEHIKEFEESYIELNAYIDHLEKQERKDRERLDTSNRTISVISRDLQIALAYYNKMRFHYPSMPNPKEFLKRDYEWLK